MQDVRTTLTIDDAAMADLRELARRDGISLKQAVNRVLEAGLQALKTPGPRERYRATTHAMGEPRVPTLDKALRLAAQLEDDEVARKLALRK